ncbi:MAG TPA: LLM class flavin-dependent oxidoreductase [Verrucomicrobiae bacterium]|nr:LLM class flavin-dependent oxidoreductase [Verrucomicrobiae bacterium]
MIELGVLDLGVREPDNTATEAVKSVLSFSQLCEELGYSRYWVAEHHEGNSSYCAPDILIGWLASQTHHIRLGSAGILLRYRDPYLTAQAFSLLGALYPNRIDLGIARGSIGGSIREYFARQDTSPRLLDEKCARLARMFQVNEKLSFLRPHEFLPTLWLMGGKNAALTAAKHKMNFCLDSFFQLPDDQQVKETLEQYTDTFRERSMTREPEYAVAIAGICATTEKEAQELLNNSAASGFPIGLIKPAVVGSPETWKAYIAEKTERWGLTTLIVLVATLDPAARRKSLQLIAHLAGIGLMENEARLAVVRLNRK